MDGVSEERSNDPTEPDGMDKRELPSNKSGKKAVPSNNQKVLSRNAAVPSSFAHHSEVNTVQSTEEMRRDEEPPKDQIQSDEEYLLVKRQNTNTYYS